MKYLTSTGSELSFHINFCCQRTSTEESKQLQEVVGDCKGQNSDLPQNLNRLAKFKNVFWKHVFSYVSAILKIAFLHMYVHFFGWFFYTQDESQELGPKCMDLFKYLVVSWKKWICLKFWNRQ